MNTREALHQLASIHPILQESVHDFETHFGSDIPVAGYGALGTAVIENLESIGEATANRFFDEVEAQLTCGLENVETAVATGLLEAVVSSATRNGVANERISDLLRPKSAEYVNEWNSFHGITDD